MKERIKPLEMKLYERNRQYEALEKKAEVIKVPRFIYCVLLPNLLAGQVQVLACVVGHARAGRTVVMA